MWHREIAVYILNEKNELLIQKRAANKKLAANKWALCAGHIEASETIIEAAMREVQEEVGIKNLSPADFILFDIRKTEVLTDTVKNNHYKYCYILKTNLKENEFVIQEEELSEVKYVSFEDLINLTDEERKDYTRSLSKENIEMTVEKIENKLKELKED
ncbi:MAG: NUDIX domain-containing protein [Clostridia bacterium]|nr:NUDIX domain-containing protein [Clostridia bacterium]